MINPHRIVLRMKQIRTEKHCFLAKCQVSSQVMFPRDRLSDTYRFPRSFVESTHYSFSQNHKHLKSVRDRRANNLQYYGSRR